MEGAEEFGAFFERVFDPLVGALWLYCGDRWVAEEIAQEALARVARDWPKVGQMAAPMGWAHRVAFNLAHSHFRRARIGRRVMARHARQDRAEPVITEVIPEALVVREAVRALPPRQRQAVPLEQVDRPTAEQVWQRGRRLRTRRRALTAAGATVAVVVAVAVGLGAPSTVFDPIPPVSERPGNGAGGWSEVPAAPLEARSRHRAVWAGDRLVVWGGLNRDFDYFNEGAVFDPETGEWATLPPAPLDGRVHPVTVWTGEEVLVTGGMVSTGRSRQGDAEVVDAGAGEIHFTDGAAWDPDTGQWRAIAEFPLDGRARPATAWTGQELIVWGGVSSLFTGPRTTLADGAIYDPDTDTWQTMAPAPLKPRADATAVWTGDRLIVWGGMGTETDNGLAPPNPNPLVDGAVYDPATDTWTPIADGPEFGGSPAFERHDAVWTGNRMIVWFGRQTAAYDSATDSWERLADWPADGTQVFPRAVWTGQELVSWGGWIEVPGDAGRSGIGSHGYAFDPQKGDWRELPDSPSPARDDHTLTPTPAGVIIWGGTSPRTGLTALVGDDFADMNTGVVYHP